jgi:hypothetical protein
LFNFQSRSFTVPNSKTDQGNNKLMMIADDKNACGEVLQERATENWD